MNDTIALETRNLTVVYGQGNTEIKAIEGVCVALRQGEIAALLGPSGAGKSTLLKAIGLIQPPTSGQVWIDGQLVMDGPRALAPLAVVRRKTLGFVFQKSNLIPFLSAVENVQLAMEIDGTSSAAARTRAVELLTSLGIGDRIDNLPATLSGGQQQRVAVARALANHPRVVLADEPTAALDSVRGRQVMELLRTVAHDHRAAVLVVTHDHRSLDVFDTIHEMEDGTSRSNRRPGGGLD